eukprot:TRINITY_DN15022_c1_g1_i1.p1 TRINITY_DN15022_c1_g1~~TRINITY_DN15022_c1_g1_i1.p1  ORF type:complete len:642 (+),score=175.04 TRINITY_DN15022_c1_g1_i1:42-1928(+)
MGSAAGEAAAGKKQAKMAKKKKESFAEDITAAGLLFADPKVLLAKMAELSKKKSASSSGKKKPKASKTGVKRKKTASQEEDASAKRPRSQSESSEGAEETAAAAATAEGAAPGSCEAGGSSSSRLSPAALAYRRTHEIIVPAGCPAPLDTFKEAEKRIGFELVKAMRDQGFTAPTPIQAQGWPIAMQGLDMVGVAKTGSGKTCAFMLPGLVRLSSCDPASDVEEEQMARPRLLVLAPTRELAQQISVEAKKLAEAIDASVVCLFGGAPKGEQARELKAGADVVVATPGRLIDFCTGDKQRNIAPIVSLRGVCYLVLDEADRMLDMGFEAEIRKIMRQCAKPADAREEVLAGSARQTLFFTATWPVEVQRVARSLTRPTAVQLRIGQGASGSQLTANASIQQAVRVVPEDDKLEQLEDILIKELLPNETAIIFASRKKTCDVLEQHIQGAMETETKPLVSWCKAIHGDRDQVDRDKALVAFRSMTSQTTKKTGRKAVLVATDVASRGLDIPGVALVVIFDFGGEADRPGLESYVHRIGRTGRAGKTGKAITLFTSQDAGAAGFVELLKNAQQEVPPELAKLAANDSGGSGQKKKQERNEKGGKGSKGAGKGQKGGSKKATKQKKGRKRT